MGESTAKLKTATERLLSSICLSQLKKGCWEDSVVKTIENLYYLSLLAPEKSGAGKKAVDWLLEKEHPQIEHVSGDGSPYSNLFFRVEHDDVEELYRRKDLPFNRGCSGFYKTGAALYFSGIFGAGQKKRVTDAFKSLDKVLVIRRGKWCSLACSGNILRGYVAHPKKKNSSQTRKALKYLEKVQSETGTWKGTPFFYQTLNTVAHSSLPTARRQIKRAIPRILRSQNRDGTWGRTHIESNTFMVLDGLRRQGLIPKLMK